jgi:two-component system sensor histidine kinase VicK
MEIIEPLKLKLVKAETREKELLDQLEELSDFIENASLPMHWVNGSGIVIWVNKAELDMLGYTNNEFINKHISNYHADKDVIEDILTRLINKETLLNYPARLKCKNGDIRHVLINSNLRWKNDEFIHTRCFTRDITELKHEEERKHTLFERMERDNQKLNEEIAKLKTLLLQTRNPENIQ